jgi:RNA polymerase sigma factor (sigma-70 family)
MGFAWKKTHDVFLAEDLAQEILTALTGALKRHESIADLDGFVFTVSCYTWSKFLRGNKRHWDNLDIDALDNLQSGQQVEIEVENAMIIERLQTEIAYLTGLHRKILIMFYYENKTGVEIAKLLDIPPGTVRWHVSEIKKKLKEGIEMEENVNFGPKRLLCGHDGWANDFNMHGIGQNPLVDSICIVCYGKELSIEEISRTLRVAAAYIEPLVKDLLYMDYFRITGKSKYTTNFYIETSQFKLSEARYYFHNIEPLARHICEVFRQHLDEIKAIGFVGSDLNSDFLLWALIPVALQNIYYKSLESLLGKNKIIIDTPLRKDGTLHWVKASFKDDEEALGFTSEEKDFSVIFYGNGIKSRCADTGERSLQYDGYATIQTGIHWREFGSDDDLRAIRHIAELIRKNETPNDYDKMKIASFVQQGYAKTEDGHPRLLIPFFDAAEWVSFNKVLDKIQKEICETLFEGFIEGFADAMEKEIPSFISRDEKIYLKYSAYPQYAVLYWLADNGFLRYPTEEEAKRLCTVVWCEG